MFVTGGSRGIGAATAVLAAERGFDVAFTYRRDADAASAVAAACAERGAATWTGALDAGDPDSVAATFAALDEACGAPRAFVNNAGILHRAATVDEIEVDRLREVVDVNVIGAFVAAREAVRRMSTRLGGAGGTIVNVSSAASYLGSPREFVDYAATKGAIDSMTIGLAKEVADEGVRVNAVRPGLIDTDIHESSGIEHRVDRLAPSVPMRRGGRAGEVAEAIMWLSSDASSYVTGTFLDVTGGR
jgi:NAD(P)-dependent dehydrogenase (short-subunit alcohol dehydrogenase family)